MPNRFEITYRIWKNVGVLARKTLGISKFLRAVDQKMNELDDYALGRFACNARVKVDASSNPPLSHAKLL